MRVFRPGRVISRISQLSLSELWAGEIRCLLLDVDNTIAHWNGHDIEPDIELWLSQARAMGFALVLISNNRAERIQPLADKLHARMLPAARKPRRRAFVMAAASAGISCTQCAMIGDQLMTDIVGANRAGMHTVLVNPLHSQEFFGTKINRRIERTVMCLLRIQRP